MTFTFTHSELSLLLRCYFWCTADISGGENWPPSASAMKTFSICDCWSPFFDSCVLFSFLWQSSSQCWFIHYLSHFFYSFTLYFLSVVISLQVSDFYWLIILFFSSFLFFPCRKLDAFIYDAAVLNYMARKDEGCKVRNRSVILWVVLVVLQCRLVCLSPLLTICFPISSWIS